MIGLPDDIELRPAAVGDADAIATFVREQMARPQRAADLVPYLEDYPSCVAHRGGELVGFAYCGSFAPDILELRNLVVRRGARRQGVGSALLAMIEEVAWAHAAAIVLVNSDLYAGHDFNVDARRFYEANGYTLVFRTDASRVFAKRRR